MFFGGWVKMDFGLTLRPLAGAARQKHYLSLQSLYV